MTAAICKTVNVSICLQKEESILFRTIPPYFEKTWAKKSYWNHKIALPVSLYPFLLKRIKALWQKKCANHPKGKWIKWHVLTVWMVIIFYLLIPRPYQYRWQGWAHAAVFCLPPASQGSLKTLPSFRGLPSVRGLMPWVFHMDSQCHSDA